MSGTGIKHATAFLVEVALLGAVVAGACALLFYPGSPQGLELDASTALLVGVPALLFYVWVVTIRLFSHAAAVAEARIDVDSGAPGGQPAESAAEESDAAEGDAEEEPTSDGIDDISVSSG